MWMLIVCVCFSHVQKRSLSRVSSSFFFGSFGTPLGLSLLGLVGFFSSPNSSLAFASLLLLIRFSKNNNSINKNNQFLRLGRVLFFWMCESYIIKSRQERTHSVWWWQILCERGREANIATRHELIRLCTFSKCLRVIEIPVYVRSVYCDVTVG